MTRALPSIVAGMLAVVLVTGSRAAEPAVDRDSVDCGMYALYHLLRLEGVDVSDDRLRAALPSPHPEGYSMKELRDVAADLGLGLRGVSLKSEPEAIDRPMLAFLRMGERGHYVVVRPVGHTGQLVQIIDDTGDPLVIDSSMLFASPAWTGTVLIPRRTNWPAVLSCGGLVALVGLGLICHRAKKGHGKSDVPDDPCVRA